MTGSLLTALCAVALAVAPGSLDDALAQEAAGEDAKAVATLRALIAREPLWDLPRLELARLDLKLGVHLDEAEALLRAAVARAPTSSRAAFLWGSVLAEQGRSREAMWALEKAVALRPDLVEARMKLGALYLGAGDDLHAEAHFRAVTRQVPGEAYPRVQLASALVHQGRLDEAASELRAVLAAHPESALARRLLAEIAERQGHPEVAAQLRADPGVSKPAGKKMRTLPKSRR